MLNFPYKGGLITAQRLLLCLVVLWPLVGIAQTSTFRVSAYNILNYSDADTAQRNPDLRIIIPQLNADILAATEIVTTTAASGLLNRVLNYNSIQYAMAPFIDGFDTDAALYYRSSKFQYLSTVTIPTALRNVYAYTLKYIPSGDTIRILAVHLKASSGNNEEALRSAEVDSIRKYTNALQAGSHFIVCGDFNIYTTNEPAYTKLLAITPGKEGQVYDPLTLTGTFNNPAYAIHHTQSTRVRAFNNGSTGGMDDRFDMILYSKALRDSGGITYVGGSLTAFGNDGNHYNDSINMVPNTAVTQQTANALHNASDHLPVYADFRLSSISTQDVSAEQLILPSLSSCSLSNKSFAIAVKNNAADTVFFSQKNMTLSVTVQAPASAIQNYQVVQTSGVLAPGQTQNFTVINNYNFNPGLQYTFTGRIMLAGDPIPSNDSLAAVNLLTPAGFSVTIDPPQTDICTGSTVILTASGAATWNWSGGQTTQAITVNNAGTYTVTATDATGCTATSTATVATFSNSADTIVYENMGSVSATTSITSHESANGFLRDDLTMSGNADIRNTNPSTGYTLASANANVFLTNTIGRNFVVSGINTLGYSSLQLSFGIFKSTTASTGADFEVSYSTDGTNYFPLTFPALSGSAAWTYRTVAGTLPSTANLRLQFRQAGNANQYRIDDLLLTGIPKPSINSLSGSTICNGDSSLLTTGSGQQFLWSTGATTASIYAKTAGNYFVAVDCASSDTFNLAVVNCSLSTLTLKLFLQGYYTGNQQMSAVLYQNNPGIAQDVVDSIQVRLYSANNPSTLLYSGTTLLKTNGQAILTFPANLNGQQVYVSVRHRNSLETWSKQPVVLNSTCSWDFAF